MTDSQKLDLILHKLEKLDTLEERFDNLEKRLDNLEKRFDNLETRLDNLEKRFDNLEKRLDNLEERFNALEERFDSLEEEVHNLKERFDNLEKDVHDLQERFNTLEDNVTGIRLTLENEVRVNIQRVAEGHLDLSRIFHDAMQPSSEVEMLAIKVRQLEADVRILKQKLA